MRLHFHEQARQESNLEPPVLEPTPSNARVGAFVDFQGLSSEPATPASLHNAGVGTNPDTEKTRRYRSQDSLDETGPSDPRSRSRLPILRASSVRAELEGPLRVGGCWERRVLERSKNLLIVLDDDLGLAVSQGRFAPGVTDRPVAA
jgi:hypothetical protein